MSLASLERRLRGLWVAARRVVAEDASMRAACFGIVLVAACGNEGATAVDGGVDAVGADAAEGELAAEAIGFAEAGMVASFDVVPDVTGDGRDDVVIRYFSRAEGPEVVIARLEGGALVRVASIEGNGEELMGPRVLVADVVGDAAVELLMAGPYDGVLYGFATPMAGDGVVGDAVVALEGPRNSFFATMHTRGALLAGGGEALVFATPGEPEEACFSSEPPVLLRRPLPASGTVAAAAAARFAADDPFACPGMWMTGDRDWTGDGVDDLVVASTNGGGRLFAGPIEDGRAFGGGVALAVGHGPYGGYGVAGGAVVDVDGDGAMELGLVDQTTRTLRVWAAPIDAARSVEVALGEGAPALVDGPRPPDLDGDGDAELVVIDELFGPTRLTVITLPEGTRRASTRGLIAARTGDLDGDGRAEIVARGPDGFYLLRVP